MAVWSSCTTSLGMSRLVQAWIILCCRSSGRSPEIGIDPSSSFLHSWMSASKELAIGCSEVGMPIQSFIVSAAALSVLASERKWAECLSRSALKFKGSLLLGRRERISRPSFREASNASWSRVRSDIAARNCCRCRPCICDRRSLIFLFMSW